MPALLVKDSPQGLNGWLKGEAHLNRRSLSQQILVCLEWGNRGQTLALSVAVNALDERDWCRIRRGLVRRGPDPATRRGLPVCGGV